MVNARGTTVKFDSQLPHTVIFDTPGKPVIIDTGEIMIPADFNPHRRLASRGEAREALDTTVEQTGGTLRIFDDCGQYFGFERASFASALRKFLVHRVNGQAIIILHDTSHIERRCPRLVNTLRRFSAQIRILKTPDLLRAVARGMIIADQGVLISRPQFDQPVSFIDYDEQAVNSAIVRFGQLLEASEPALSGSVTGL